MRASVTVVPLAGFGAKNPLGISTVTGTLATSTQLLGRVIFNVPLMMAAVALVQLASPITTTKSEAGVVPANTGTPPAGLVLATESVSVPLPFTAILGVNVMFMDGTSPACRLLNVTVNCRGSAVAKRRRALKRCLSYWGYWVVIQAMYSLVSSDAKQ